jgi:hypothetical protein
MTADRWLAVALVVVSGLITWNVSRYYYRRSDKKRVPAFVVQSTSTLSEPVLSSISGVKLAYDGEDVGKSGIADAKIYFWNSGTLPGRRSGRSVGHCSRPRTKAPVFHR